MTMYTVLHPVTMEAIGTTEIDDGLPSAHEVTVKFYNGFTLLISSDSLEWVDKPDPEVSGMVLNDVAPKDINSWINYKTEVDPNGLDPHSPGAKLDEGKIMAGLVLGDFANALTEVCKVGTFGADKYTPHGWLSVQDGEQRYTNAMMRHWMAEATEGEWDRDGLRHAAQVAWNALARLELKLRNGETPTS